MMHLIKNAVMTLFLGSLLLGIESCGDRNRAASRLAEDSEDSQVLDSSLTFKNVTLEQADEEGRPFWKVDALQATYDKDEQLAQIQQPKGELFQDGKLVYQVEADTGEVEQDGEKIFLKGNIIAKDVQSGATLRGNELEWQPREDLLIVRNKLTGTHPQVVASAQEARLFSREQRMELEGNVLATAKDPNLKLKAEKLVWYTDQERIVSDQPIEVEQYEAEQTTGRATGDQAEVDLAKKIAILKQNSQLTLQDPSMQIISELFVWNVENETVVANQPITVNHLEQAINLSANQARMDLKQQIAYLTGNVKVLGQLDQSQLDADKLTWYIDSQEVEAEGNVAYRRPDPPFDLRGPKAFGKFENQTVVVSGGGGQVVTEIIPEGLE
ncbi:MAG: LPS export ABC transporter periplasmic protein LptC [Cyanothece sp. SIO1E1]|nr:LPS export ABC transporter periplasmic protein LptC [Cyanothece sp. SIO1E1]